MITATTATTITTTTTAAAASSSSKIIQNVPLRFNVSFKLSGGRDPYCLLGCVW